MNFQKTKNNKVNGVLLFNKPLGLSSNTALQKIKRIYNAKKAGHTGTLDPLATGLLPICFGEATKFSSFLLDGNKEYIATIKLGQITTTYDAEGEITNTSPVDCNQEQISQCISSFIGTITQVPPIYSALKVNGRALYDYARSGETIAIKSREISIHEIELIKQLSHDVLCIRVSCSKGTYIRSLAHDLGQKLGCGAHLIGLVRTKINQFTLNENITLELLSSYSDADRQAQLLPSDIMISHFPRLDLSEEEFIHIRHGHEFHTDTVCQESDIVRLYYLERFLGIANSGASLIKPIRLISDLII